MDLVFIILPFALLIAAGVLLAFIWAARSGQFDDLETPGRRILLDDAPRRAEPEHAAAPQGPSATGDEAQDDAGPAESDAEADPRQA